jgi:hypothetical protein
MALRNFIYIDKNKMYSFYSQIFEGVAESLVKSVFYSNEDKNMTGKKLEETLIEASVKVQNVVLFDHIYNSLEAKMLPNILVIDDKTVREDITPSSIIKVSGYVTIEDYEHLSYLMDNFNDIGLAVANMQMQSNDTNKKSNNSIEKYAKETGLTLDKKFTASIVKILENFHGDSMEIVIENSESTLDIGFKALLDPNYLRISPNALRILYGHKPCMKWTMVGEVTDISYIAERHQGQSKNAFSELFMHLNDVDHSFSKSTDDSCDMIRISPIAVYIEHESITAAPEGTAVDPQI